MVRLRGQWIELDAATARGRPEARRPDRRGQRSATCCGSGSASTPAPDEPAGRGGRGRRLARRPAVRTRRAAARGRCDTPDSFDGQLRPYQARGLAWLDFLGRAGLGGVLADDMGLGKTVQLLALLACAADRPRPPSLLVCPMSLVGNWQREAARFTPQLRVHVHHGAERARGEAFTEAVAGCDLVDHHVRARRPRRRRAAQDHLAAGGGRRGAGDQERGHQAGHRDPLDPGGDPDRGHRNPGGEPAGRPVVDPGVRQPRPARIGGGVQEALRRADRAATATTTPPTGCAASPGRSSCAGVKTDTSIIADLPEKLEMDLLCNLTAEQAALYQAVVDDMLERIRTAEGIERRGLVLATMTKLKQVCNHPAHFLRDGSRLAGRSGKLERLDEILDEVLAAGEKALLFTQYAEFGALLRGHLAGRFGREVLFLHGGVSQAGAGRDGRPVPGRRRVVAAAVRAVAEGRRHRADPDRGQPRRARRPLVEPGGRGPGHRPGVPDRAAPGRAGPQVRLRRHGRGEDRGDDHATSAAWRPRSSAPASSG